MPTKSSQDQTQDIARERVGAIYARALLGATEKTGTTEAVLAELESLIRDVLDEYAQLEAILESPRVSSEEKMEVMRRVFGDTISDQLLVFLEVVCAHGRLDCLRQIQQQARRQLDEMRGLVEVRLTTAEPVPDSLNQKIAEVLQQSLGRDIRLRTSIDPDLIGGMVVRVGDKVYDASVARQLWQLRAETLEKTVNLMRSTADRFAVGD